MTLGPYNISDIIRNPFLILVILGCSLILILLSKMALTAPPGHYWRGAIIPQFLGCLDCLVLWYVFSGSDAFVPIVFAVPASGPIFGALWVWWDKRREAAKAQALREAAAEVVEKVADASPVASTNFDSNLATMEIGRSPGYLEPAVNSMITPNGREGLVQTAQPPSSSSPTAVILMPRLSLGRSFELEVDDLESGYATPRDYRIRTFPPFLPIEVRAFAATACG
ncbi:hypothetical protein Pmar_PMAR003159 [Perkinsus marinus ATCC 50983]|uniref:Uncharacterized protein n=1 Tax=Perkinsus marinus (strain ATCC 50983 / TXsc) TaxID=423536 RepID=C5L324_PERM5|nr:hypothetical protein Pmar_PMAR003159 [Perkinsus marinus ATCC 50983]EER08911.1 hypothetical protein Pmar_PMAR003159 [Perkinsus marinus ATCC 50983]|eukprot:XP_002777095.1 hypothetical protein Pmar_PMAR003159 [Perkinsus marinus ATCC 50983]